MEEQKYVLRHLVRHGYTFTWSFNDLQATFEDDCMGRTTAYNWWSKFKNGETSIERKSGSGRPQSSRIETNIEFIRQLLDEDNRLTIREISMMSQLSYGTVSTILHEDLELTLRCVKWIPHALSVEQQKCRVRVAKQCLKLCKNASSWIDYCR